MAGKETFTSCWFGAQLIPLANACINSFGAHGFPFNLYTHGWVKDVPDFVDRRDAEPIVRQDELFIAHGGIETSTELFIYRFLERFGGWYVDNDVVCNADRVPDAEIAFAEERVGVINNAVLKFPKYHPAIIELLEYVATIDPVTSPWGTTGPLALSKIFHGRPGLAMHKLATADAYPLHWREAPKLLFPEFTREVIEKTAHSPFIHLWGSALREISVDFNESAPLPGSYLDLLYSRCLDPQIRRRLRPLREQEFRRSVRQYVERNWSMSLPLEG